MQHGRRQRLINNDAIRARLRACQLARTQRDRRWRVLRSLHAEQACTAAGASYPRTCTFIEPFSLLRKRICFLIVMQQHCDIHLSTSVVSLWARCRRRARQPPRPSSSLRHPCLLRFIVFDFASSSPAVALRGRSYIVATTAVMRTENGACRSWVRRARCGPHRPGCRTPRSVDQSAVLAPGANRD